MKISPAEAEAFFADPSQQVFGIDPKNLPGAPFEYWADGTVCGAAHPWFYGGVWVAHFAVKPEGRGKCLQSALRILDEFWREKRPSRLIGWTPAKLKHAVALSRRVGFVQDGILPLPDGDVVMSGFGEEQWALIQSRLG